MTGTIRTVIIDRGFGFLRPQGATSDVFFHIADCDQAALPWDEQLVERRVSFEIVTRDGRERAVNVQPATEP